MALTIAEKLRLVEETSALRRRLLGDGYISAAERPLLKARLLELEQAQAAVEEAEAPKPPPSTIDGRIGRVEAAARAKLIRQHPGYWSGDRKLVQEHNELMERAHPDAPDDVE